MKSIFLVSAALLLNGCSNVAPAPASGVEIIASTSPKQRTLAQFKDVTVSTPMSAVTKKFGSPDADVGSGIFIYVYQLSDGSSIQLGSGNRETLIYVDHVGADGRRQRLSPATAS